MGSVVVPFLGRPYRVLNMNPKKELLWSLWVMLAPIQDNREKSRILSEGPKPTQRARENSKVNLPKSNPMAPVT